MSLHTFKATGSSLTLAALLAASLFAAGCAADASADGDDGTSDDGDVASSEAAVTGGAITTARPEIGLVHVDGVRGFLGDMGWGTGTVVLQRNVVLTSVQTTGGKSLAPLGAAGGASYGTFTVTSPGGRTVHRIVEAKAIDGTKLALLRIEPSVDASIVPADLADPETVSRVKASREPTSFLGYGYRNHVCMPMTGSDGHKSFVTRRYRQFGGLFTGPLGVGYTCEGDIGGPIVLGRPEERGAVLSVNVNTVLDTFAEPGRSRGVIEGVARAWR